MLTGLFLAALWLFIGSLIMLVTNELIPGGVTRWEFLKGMLVWPWMLGVFLLELVRLLLVL